MKRESDNDAVDDSIAEITKTEEQGKAEVIEAVRDERLGDHRPRGERFLSFLKSGKGLALLAVLVLVAVIFAVPMTRYAALGVFVKKPTTVIVVDDATGKPVSEVTVAFGRQDGKTDKNGAVTFSGVSVGDHPLKAEKKYYTTAETSFVVPVINEAKTTIKLKATGRVATVNVTNAISGKPLAGATVKVGDAVATADDNGAATIALATKDSDQTGEVSLKDFQTVDISVNTKDMAPSVDAKLYPDGKVYFLSNRAGTYDVMSSTLDGEDQQVVAKGTGSELAYELQLVPSPTRQYLALKARRGSDKEGYIYVIDTATNAISKVENSNGPSLIGWINNTFYYGQYNYNNGQIVDGRAKLVSYNAASKQNSVIDASKFEGDQWGNAELGLGTFHQLVGDRIYYAKCWSYNGYYTGNRDRKASLMAVVDGKAVSLKDVDQNGGAYCGTVATKPDTVYYQVTFSNDSHSDSYRYILGKAVEAVQVSDGQLYNNSYTYLMSPNGKRTFWTETRDGQDVSFVGDANGQNAQQVSAANYKAYGWVGDDYVLYSKGGSELYVAAAGAQLDGAHKITNFYSQRGPGY